MLDSNLVALIAKLKKKVSSNFDGTGLDFWCCKLSEHLRLQKFSPWSLREAQLGPSDDVLIPKSQT